MSVNKTAVFISSRFEEFRELRTLLEHKINACKYPPLHAINLDDNGAGISPPEVVSVDMVRRSELLVLFLGDTYGPSVKTGGISHTHVEYRAAAEDESNTRILPFIIRDESDDQNPPLQDERLAAFQREVMEDQTVATYARPQSGDGWIALAETICNCIIHTIHEIQFRDLNPEVDLDNSGLLDPAGISDTEIERINSFRSANSPNLELLIDASSLDGGIEAIYQPRAIEAAEQLREARTALYINETGIAEQHLRNAVSIRPLDPVGNEWLARVLLSKRRLKATREAMIIADRSARIYRKSNQDLRASVASILAARAAGQLDQTRGVAYANMAVIDASWFSQAHLELARQLAPSSSIKDVLAALDNAFRCYPSSVDNILTEPAFSHQKKELQEHFGKWHQRIIAINNRIIHADSGVAKALGASTIETSSLTKGSLSRLVYSGRFAMIKLLRRIQIQAHKLLEANRLNQSSPLTTTYTWDAAWVALSASRSIEIVKLNVEEGQSVRRGQTLLSYAVSGSQQEQTLVAPIDMHIVAVPKKRQSLKGREPVLIWIPAPCQPGRQELEAQLDARRKQLTELETVKDTVQGHQKRSRAIRIGHIAVAVGLGMYAWLSHTHGVIRFAEAGGAIYLLYAAISRSKLLSKLEDRRTNLNKEIDGASSVIANLESLIAGIQRLCVAAENDLNQAIGEYEKALSMTPVSMPFPGLRAAKTGDWVVVARDTVERYSKTIGLTVTFENEPLGNPSNSLALYRVVRRYENMMHLDQRKAYFPM